MEKIVLIDGNSIINRAFYGMPDLTNAEGLHTGAVIGFINIMNRILDEEKPDYLLVAFDVKAPTFRHKIYDAYKGTRKSMPDELRQQVPVLKELLKAMNVSMYEEAGLEADDILGAMAKRAEKAGMAVSLVSGDRDLLQVATDVIKVRIPKTKSGKTEIEDYYTEDVIAKYQVPPLGIIELKALMGDSSDNIPGVPKIGEKTATELLLQYGNIETLKEHISEITKKSIRETLEQNFDMAVLSKTLATINVDAEIKVDFEDLRHGNLYTKEAYPICKNLGFKKLLEKFELTEEETITQEKTLVEINSIDEFKEVLSNIQEYAGIELNLKADTLSVDGNGQACFVFDEPKKEIKIHTEDNVYYVSGCSADAELSTSEFNDAIECLQNKIISSDGITYVFNDFKNALFYLDKLEDTKLASEKIFDIVLAAYLLNPNAGSYEFDDPYSKYKEFKEKLISMDMYKLFTDIEMPLSVVLYSMEKEGIKIIKDDLKKYGEELEVKIVELEKQIKEDAGIDFNVNSPKQLGEILFEKMGIPGGKKTKTGYSTAADVLEKLAEDYPFVRNILEYRGLTKLKSTYVEGMYPFIGEDSRIHCKFNQTVTATGRISCSDPNLQNIPIRTEQGRLIRKCFVPKEGYVFADADYSQIELRIMAHMSQDEKLIEAYREARDIHRITASEVFSVPFDEVSDLQRRNAKAVNFGIIYGISSFGLSQDLSISRKEAKEYIDNYFVKFPKVKEYLDNCVNNAKADGFVKTLYGRIRQIPELSSSNFMQKQFGERVAMNAPIQGTAADIMKIGMINVYNLLKEKQLKSKLILQVHDELLIETANDEVDIVKSILLEGMKNAANLSVDLEIDTHVGNTWYESK